MLKRYCEWFYYIAGLIDNDEKLRSFFWKNTEQSKQFKTGVQKPYPVWDQNDQNRYSISDQNVFKKPHPLRLEILLQPIEGSTALSPWAVKGKYHK